MLSTSSAKKQLHHQHGHPRIKHCLCSFCSTGLFNDFPPLPQRLNRRHQVQQKRQLDLFLTSIAAHHVTTWAILFNVMNPATHRSPVKLQTGQESNQLEARSSPTAWLKRCVVALLCTQRDLIVSPPPSDVWIVGGTRWTVTTRCACQRLLRTGRALQIHLAAVEPFRS